MKLKISLLLSLFFYSQVFALEGVDCSIAKIAIKQASEIRGLASKEDVVCKLQNKQEVERYLREAIASEVPKERIQAEGELYKILGFIPEDFDYFNGIIEMYLSQLGGYYDSSKNYYAMASWMPGIMQMPIAIHELTHALQDQHYNLDTLLDHKKGQSDELQAISALVEGDATAVMLDYSREQIGLSKMSEEQNVSGFMLQNLSGLMLSGNLKNTPGSLQAMMIFPYVSGLNFAHTLLQKGGYSSIDEAFLKPPTSTEEILHPEKYLSNEKSYQKVTQTIVTGDVPVFEDSLGEFFIVTLLKNWLDGDKASSAASGWGGDLVSLFEDKLIWKILWDTENDGEEFYKAIVEAYEIRFKTKPQIKLNQASFENDLYKSFAITISKTAKNKSETTIVVEKNAKSLR